MERDFGLHVEIQREPLGFRYGEGVCGPVPEIRRLDDIRPSLLQPDCTGPREVYCIAMDVMKKRDREDLETRHLLYGIVTYAGGRLGNEPVRSQGHIHAASRYSNMSTCEVYEIWEGRAIIYMQRCGGDDAGDCYAVYGNPGDVIIVPPGWVHATVNASCNAPMTFGAWCVRDYAFDYADVRRHHGIAFFPIWQGEAITWQRNERYASGILREVEARDYPEFGLEAGTPIYSQYEADRNRFDFVVNPGDYRDLWRGFRA